MSVGADHPSKIVHFCMLPPAASGLLQLKVLEQETKSIGFRNVGQLYCSLYVCIDCNDFCRCKAKQTLAAADTPWLAQLSFQCKSGIDFKPSVQTTALLGTTWFSGKSRFEVHVTWLQAEK
eukprot:2187181-Amphidinium_carterae.1